MPGFHQTPPQNNITYQYIARVNITRRRHDTLEYLYCHHDLHLALLAKSTPRLSDDCFLEPKRMTIHARLAMVNGHRTHVDGVAIVPSVPLQIPCNPTGPLYNSSVLKTIVSLQKCGSVMKLVLVHSRILKHCMLDLA